MRICVVASTYPRFETDGSGRFVRSICEALAAIGHEVHVLAPFHPTVTPYASLAKLHHFRYVWPDSLSLMGYAQAMASDQALRPYAYALSPLYAVAEYIALNRLMQRYRFDAIHVHWVIPNAPVAAWIARANQIPLVISLHGSDIFMALRHRALQPAARWSFTQAQAVSVCSPELQAGAVQLGAAPEKVRLLPWGADLETFDRQHDLCRRVTALRKQWQLDADQPVILSLGRLVRKKGVRYLIEALPSVVRACPNVRCVVAGAGPELDELRSLAAASDVADNVTFTGSVDWNDVPAYLSLSDLFVVPSVHDEQANVDHLPTTILEAMAAGKPVVASRVSGIPLVVGHGKTGFLVDEQNPQQLADGSPFSCEFAEFAGPLAQRAAPRENRAKLAKSGRKFQRNVPTGNL